MMHPLTIVSLWDMKRIYAGNIMGAAGQLERVDLFVEERKEDENFNVDDKADAQTRNHIAGYYSRLESSAEAMDCTITAKSAARAVQKLRGRKKVVTWAEIGSISKELFNVLQDEVASVQLFCLNKGAEKYYSPRESLFGKKVESRIPKAADDISEAGKCFAVGRYTASAFHLMRAMEAGVQELSAKLNIADVDREWGKLLSDIAKAIEPMPKGAARDSWSEVHANLYHVKQAWRNSTMHPKRTYTEEEAREVFDAMKAFMRHLAGMLPPSAEELMAD